MYRIKNHIPEAFLWEYTLPAKELATKYGIGLSTVYKWRKAAEKGELWRFRHDIPIDGRILGILWSLGRDDGESFILRYRNKEILEEIRDYFRLKNKIMVGRSRTGLQYKIKINGNARCNIINKLSTLGWAERNADERQYPLGKIDHRGFVKVYLEIHSSLDKGGRRLRIYGNRVFIEKLNEILSEMFGVKKKKPQKVTGKTYVLYYQNREEIEKLCLL